MFISTSTWSCDFLNVTHLVMLNYKILVQAFVSLKVNFITLYYSGG